MPMNSCLRSLEAVQTAFEVRMRMADVRTSEVWFGFGKNHEVDFGAYIG